MDEERICKNADALFERLKNAYTSMSIFGSLMEVYNSQERYLLLPNISFWRAIIDNCVFRVLVELAKVYEEGQEAIGVQRLINQVEQTRCINSVELVQSAKTKYAALTEAREKLKILRDKGLVHADKKYMSDLDHLLSEYGLSVREIYVLLNTATEICNDIMYELTGMRKSIALALNDDARGVLEEIRIAHRVREKRNENQQPR